MPHPPPPPFSLLLIELEVFQHSVREYFKSRRSTSREQLAAMRTQLPHCYCVYGQGKLVFIIIATSTALRYSTGLTWINAIIQSGHTHTQVKTSVAGNNRFLSKTQGLVPRLEILNPPLWLITFSKNIFWSKTYRLQLLPTKLQHQKQHSSMMGARSLHPPHCTLAICPSPSSFL